MASTCVVVADGARARFFLMPSEAAGKLVEQALLENPEHRHPETESRRTDHDAGPMHPYGAQRERHRLEHEKRFAGEVVSRAAEKVREMQAGTLVVVADPRLLGLMRESLRSALHPSVQLRELARDYTNFSVTDLQEQLVSSNMLAA